MCIIIPIIKIQMNCSFTFTHSELAILLMNRKLSLCQSFCVVDSLMLKVRSCKFEICEEVEI